MHACLPFWLEAGLLHGNLAQKEGTIVLQIVTQALKKVYLSTVFPNFFFTLRTSLKIKIFPDPSEHFPDPFMQENKKIVFFSLIKNFKL